jgi:hypothetical protein
MAARSAGEQHDPSRPDPPHRTLPVAPRSAAPDAGHGIAMRSAVQLFPRSPIACTGWAAALCAASIFIMQRIG